MNARHQAQALLDQSLSHWDNGNMEGLIECSEKILELVPGDGQAIANKGTALWALGRSEEAEDYFRRALKTNPDWPSILLNVATVCHDQGKLEEAMDYINRLLKISPVNSQGLWRKGILDLALGNYIDGWSGYEAGLDVAELRGKLPPFSKRPWQGKACKNLFILAEQGIGDTLQFIRYAKLCKERAMKVYFHGEERLRRIVTSCPYIDGFMGEVIEGEYDEYIYTLSLPHVFKTTVESIPHDVPYLVVPNDVQEKWTRVMGEKTGLRVGLVWAGANRAKYQTINARRSMRLAQFRPLIEAFTNIEFYSLQKGEEENEILPEDRLINYMPGIDDLVDTAAVINNLDLVLSVDTSVVHLAGALAKPVWILSRFDACWRWLRNREDSPWYPTARVFGQPSQGDWDSVLQKVGEELRKIS